MGPAVKPSTAAVLELLRARGPVGATALDALDEAGSFRLAARVAELKADGFDVEATAETTPSGKRVSRYRLRETAQLPLFR